MQNEYRTMTELVRRIVLALPIPLPCHPGVQGRKPF
jgi:hypothetical protein